MPRHLVPDTEGAGRHRGAPAAYVEYGPTHGPLEVLYTGDGTVYPALGARGGLPGAPERQYKRDREGVLHELASFGDVMLLPGESIVSICCGGGGYGSPLDREARQVAHDVDEGWISLDHAMAVYGVILTDEGLVDEKATDARRRSLRNALEEVTGHPSTEMGSRAGL